MRMTSTFLKPGQMHLASFLAFAGLCGAASRATGEIPVPVGLQVGDHYHLVFMSDDTRDGTSGDIADYDAVVRTASEDANIGISDGITWFAIVSTGDTNGAQIDAKDHAVVSAPVYNLNPAGPELVAADFSQMWSSNHNATIQWNEHRENLGTVDAWTGSLFDGTADTVESLYLGSSTANAWCGRSTKTNAEWLEFLKPNKTIQLHVYGLSEKLTVVPEASSVTLSAIGLVCLIVCRLRRRPIASVMTAKSAA